MMQQFQHVLIPIRISTSLQGYQFNQWSCKTIFLYHIWLFHTILCFIWHYIAATIGEISTQLHLLWIRHFQIDFHQWKLLYCDSNFTKLCLLGSNWKKSIGQYIHIMLGAEQANKDYLNNRWRPISMTHICITHPLWVEFPLYTL